MIRFLCEHCGKEFQADDRFAGLKSRCTGCWEIVKVPFSDPHATTLHVHTELLPPAEIIEAPALSPVNVQRFSAHLAWVVGAVIVASVLACGGVVVVGTLGRPVAATRARPPRHIELPPDGDEAFKASVVEALKKCVDDADGLEVIAWGERKDIGETAEGHVEQINLRFRAKTPTGGKRLREWTAGVKNGRPAYFYDPETHTSVRVP